MRIQLTWILVAIFICHAFAQQPKPGETPGTLKPAAPSPEEHEPECFKNGKGCHYLLGERYWVRPRATMT
jgi:hypothetical protein